MPRARATFSTSRDVENVFDDLAGHLLLAHEVEREQGDDFLRRDEGALLVEDAEAVGVAVVADGEVVVAVTSPPSTRRGSRESVRDSRRRTTD